MSSSQFKVLRFTFKFHVRYSSPLPIKGFLSNPGLCDHSLGALIAWPRNQRFHHSSSKSFCSRGFSCVSECVLVKTEKNCLSRMEAFEVMQIDLMVTPILYVNLFKRFIYFVFSYL